MSRARHPVFARLYARASPGMERRGAAGHRDELLAGLAGRVIEPGAGNGFNFAHYPPGVTEVLAVEPEPYLRGKAEAAARLAPVPVRVVAGAADELPAAEAEFDAAVFSLVLCSVPDQARALAEARRVLRPGGALRFYEHVRAPEEELVRVQRALDRVWPRLAGGCHLARDTVGAIREAGFAVESVRRFAFPDGLLARPASPHVIGTARRLPGVV